MHCPTVQADPLSFLSKSTDATITLPPFMTNPFRPLNRGIYSVYKPLSCLCVEVFSHFSRTCSNVACLRCFSWEHGVSMFGYTVFSTIAVSA